MVSSSKIAVVAVSTLSSFGAAANCVVGGIYCGYGLMSRQNHITQIITGLKAHQLDPSDFNQKNSLWICLQDKKVEFKGMCDTGCVTNGKSDDTCQVNMATEEDGWDWEDEDQKKDEKKKEDSHENGTVVNVIGELISGSA